MYTTRTILSLAISVAVAGGAQFAAAQNTTAPTATATTASASAGGIGGRVLSADSGSALPAASVRIEELGREVSATRDGGFQFNNLPAGDYTLVVSYRGLQSERLPVRIAAGQNLRQEVRLRSALEQITVLGQIEGQASTINIQRNAPSVRTVVSADALGQIREGNIGDALMRLPGLNAETRAGVQRTATIRGLSPQYNTITVNGIRMTNVDGNRDIALDSFPANMLARVDVIKAPTPDMSADAIGGTVDLVTRSAYDKNQRILEAQAGTTYNDNRGSWNQQYGFTWGDTFGAEQQFGLLGSISYHRDERGYDVVNTGYTVDANDEYFVNRALYYDRDEKKDKIGAGLVFDYRPSDDTSLTAKYLYHYDYRWLWRRGTDYRPNPDTAFDVTPDSASSTGGRVDSIAFYREPKNVFQMFSVGGEHRSGDWLLDGSVNYTRAKKDYPVTLQVLNSINGVDLSYDRSKRDFPVFSVDNDIDLSDPSLLSFRQYQTNQVPRLEDEWTLDANLQRELFAGDVFWTLKTGARASFKDASQAQPDTIRYTGLNGVELESLLEYYRNSDFMDPANGRGQLLPFFPDWRKYRDLHKNNSGQLTQNPAAEYYTESTIANADFAISEDIYAAYAMATAEFGQWTLLGGARFESTRIESEANEVISEGNSVTAINRVEESSDYNNLLPSLNLRYSALDDQLILRGSVSKAISRPPPGDLIPARQENSQLNQRIVGNPDLKPAESNNFDLTAEYFLPPLGLLSAGAFYKDIDNFVFSTSRIAADGVDERTRSNGDGGKVRGVELVWIQQFSGLPGIWNGLGLEANYTWLDSEGAYPDREGEDLPLAGSPRYILNGVLSYAYGPASLRLSVNKLPDRLAAVGGREALDRYWRGDTTWDLAMKYQVLDGYELFMNVKNLTNAPTAEYQGSRDNPVTYVNYGTQYTLGMNFVF